MPTRCVEFEHGISGKMGMDVEGKPFKEFGEER